jgi:VanZ family protein
LRHARELFWRYWLPVLVMLALIKLESTATMSSGHTVHLLRALLGAVGIHLSHFHLDVLNFLLRKAGHMLGYGTLCFLWMMLFRGAYWLRHEYRRRKQGQIPVLRMWWRTDWAALALLLTFLVASADELHQMRLSGRTGSWHDIALDTFAGALALGALWLEARSLCREPGK